MQIPSVLLDFIKGNADPRISFVIGICLILFWMWGQAVISKIKLVDASIKSKSAERDLETSLEESVRRAHLNIEELQKRQEIYSKTIAELQLQNGKLQLIIEEKESEIKKLKSQVNYLQRKVDRHLGHKS